MKKLLAIALASLMLFTLFACAAETPEAAPTPDATINDAPPPAAEPEPVPEPEPEPEPEPVDDFDADRVIAVFTREDGSGTRDAFASITGVGEDMYIEAVVLTSGGEIRTGVSENLYGIGYISVGSLNDTVKALTIGGIMPSSATIVDGSYAIQRPFLLVTNDEKDTDELVQDFINFVMSSQGQEEASTSWTSTGNTGEYTPGGMSGTLRVGGSTSVNPLMELLAAVYTEMNPNVTIEISGGGSGQGIEEATSGVIDIGMSSRNLKDGEKDALNEYVIALDGVAVIVNVDNPVSDIDIDTVKEIFIGEITVWREIIG